MADRRNITVEEFLEQSSKRGINRAHIEQEIRDDIGLDKFIELDIGNDKLLVTDEEVQKYYDENKNVPVSDKDRLAVIKWLARRKKRIVVDDYVDSLISKAQINWPQNR
jgi:hypothetical protein